MKAAILHALGEAPRYENEALVSMMADGSHYDSHRELPSVVGVDGVGELQDGTRVYCGGSRVPYGTMAERTVVPMAFCLPVPDAVDDLTAALPNPALASWLALERRAKLEPGETVLVLGAGRNAEALMTATGQNVKRLLAFGPGSPKKTAMVAALRPPESLAPHPIRRHRTIPAWCFSTR